MNIKKTVLLFLSAALCAALFCGCSAIFETAEAQTASAESANSAEASSVQTEDLTIEDDSAANEEVQNSEDEGLPKVYMTADISPEGLLAVYEALEWTPEGKTAVKVSTGEPPSSNYLRPELIADVVHAVDGTIVECNTAYGGERSSTEDHYKVAEEHGFTAIAPVRIQDENGSMTIPVEGGKRLTEDYVGAAFDDYDSYLILSHFKGHAMAGYGGAIKNISIGLASSEGKSLIHSGGTSLTDT